MDTMQSFIEAIYSNGDKLERIAEYKNSDVLADVIRHSVVLGISGEAIDAGKSEEGWDVAGLCEFFDSLSRIEKAIAVNVAIEDFGFYVELMSSKFRTPCSA